jgi:lysozyme
MWHLLAWFGAKLAGHIGARMAISALTLSAAGLIGIALHEGYRGDAYGDAVGVATIGFGTTEGVRRGDRITVERALVRLGQDVERFERELRACIGDVPMYQHEWDAIISWAYNVGSEAACRSTLVRKLQARDYEGACNELPRWVFAGGQRLPGLEVRRERERRQCLGLPLS